MNETILSIATDTENSANIGPHRNNSSILEQYQSMLRDNHLAGVATSVAARADNPKVPATKYVVAGHSVAVRARSVTINDDGKFGSSIELHKLYECAGVFSALSDLQTNEVTGHYAVVELGYRQYFSDAELRGRVREPRAAVITASYAGDNPKLLAVRPAQGISQLGYKQGTFIVTKNFPTAPKYNAETWLKGGKQALQFFCKHDGLDLILSGKKLYVAPWLHEHDKDENGRWVEKEAGEYGFIYSEKKSESFVATYTNALGMVPEAAAKQVAENIQRSILKKSDQKTYREVKTVVAANPEVPDMLLGAEMTVGGNEVALRDLLGKTVNVKVGTLSCGKYTVNAGNLAFIAGLYAKGRTLEIVA